MNEIISYIFIVIGALFNLFGCIGLIRLPDIYNRLQASTKCVTLGTSLLLFGVVIKTGLNATGIKAILCIIFILLTSPVAAHAISRAAHLSGIKLWEKSIIDKLDEDNKQKQNEEKGKEK
ncbi:MAG TPA: monovalent cation/H(+) antiporter subunit G [bacterium]|nr:monovalent cation/H(+) antiporter subunit G [bacterium]HOL47534.1 monovalent cation/H(+) antiporter subunit G [bacterium]HPQ19114.1 monovalent cation/H(+) antiporter subunit G [bacterium]